MAGSVPERLEELGLALSGEAVQALASLPEEHALELAGAVKAKVDQGHIKNPSNYVCATIARGYVTQADGGAMTATIARAGGAVAPAVVRTTEDVRLQQVQAGAYAAAAAEEAEEDGADGLGELLDASAYDDAANQLASSMGMQRAQMAGLQLNDEAVKALLLLPPEHASELLESVAEKHGALRDPSNYIVATVARGYVSKLPAPTAARPRAPTVVPAPAAAAVTAAVAAAAPAARPAPPSGPTSLVPEDLSPVEARVLELNALDLWQGQPIGVETLLALRCVPQEQALQLLASLDAKGRGKGSITIQSPNNYVQAAVVKIKKGMVDGSAGGYRPDGTPAAAAQWNFTGNQSRQRAKDLGLDLRAEVLELLAQVPLKDATWLLEASAWVQSQGEDPNDYIRAEAPKMVGGQPTEASAKRPRYI